MLLWSVSGLTGHGIIFMILLVALIVSSTCLVLAGNEARRRRHKLKKSIHRLSDARIQFKRLSRRIARVEELWDTRVKETISDERRVWVRKPTREISTVLSLSQRRTPFVSFLNLKGGVGKTFLAANTAVILDQEELSERRTLLIDIDFQGTLSEGSLSPLDLALQHKNECNVRQLWKASELTEETLARLTLSMTGSKAIDVCPADNPLDEADYRAQTEHLLLGRENRFHFRKLLHQEWLYAKYGLVIFDCPPRITASTVNALACSDFIVIPTRLESHSARAVPNTLVQILALKRAGVIDAKVLGVIPNEVSRNSGELIKTHQNAYSKLMSDLEAYLPAEALFPESACADGIPAHLLPNAEAFDKVAAQDRAVRQRLLPVGVEFARRLKAHEAYSLNL